jgi:hypothetical protein
MLSCVYITSLAVVPLCSRSKDDGLYTKDLLRFVDGVDFVCTTKNIVGSVSAKDPSIAENGARDPCGHVLLFSLLVRNTAAKRALLSSFSP